MLVLSVSKDFDKLLQYRRLTSVASLSELGGVVIMAVHLPFVLVIAVLSSEDSRAYGACEMFDVVFPLQCSNVRSSQRAAAVVAQ